MSAPEPLILSFPDAANPGATHHLVRAELTTKRPRTLHRHSFFELLWVQNGVVRHHQPWGHSDLQEGDLVFLRPGDYHGLQGRGEAAMVVSLSIRDETITDIARRHSELPGSAFWATGDHPAILHRDIRQMAELNHAAMRLERSSATTLALEAFLLPLLSDLASAHSGLPDDAPDWLQHACAAARDPSVFREGAAGLAKAAGRAHPHVARSMRRYMNMTPSDYVNGQRMTYAARRLTGSEDSLAEIAAECGIPNLSHFHKLFLTQHGVTPQRYRRSRRQQLIQP